MAFTYSYPRPAVSVDAVVFRKTDNGRDVLLIQRKNPPFAEQWAVPGGFLEIDETLETAVARELQEETGLQATHVEQLKAFSCVDRDPRTRVISIAFVVDVAQDQVPVAADDAKNVKWFPCDSLPTLAFDHAEMIRLALKKYP